MAMDSQQSHARGVFYGVMAGLTLSLGGPLIRYVSDAASPWQVLAWRSYAFMILMFAFALWRAGSLRGVIDETRKIGWLLLPIALSVGVGQICYLLGLLNTTVANVAFVVGSAPLVTAFAAWLILGEKLTLKGSIALMAALVGVFIMVANGLTGGAMLGNLYALGAMLTYTVYVILLRLARDIDTFVASGFGGMFAAGFAVWMAGGDLYIPPVDLTLAIALGTVQVGLGFAFVTLASQHIPAAEVTLLILIEAILGPLLVWLLISETPAAATLIGGAIVLAAVTAYASFSMMDERKAAGRRLSPRRQSRQRRPS